MSGPPPLAKNSMMLLQPTWITSGINNKHVHPQSPCDAKQSRAIEPEQLTDPIERVEIKAVFSKAVQEIAWRDLQDDRVWRQGWV